MYSDTNVSFCSLMNNTGYELVAGGVEPCYHSGDNSTTAFIKFCNIINCNQNYGGLICICENNLQLYECSIFQNTVEKMFSVRGYPKFIIIDHCYIDNPKFTRNTESIKQIKNNANDFFVYKIRHLTSAQCNDEIAFKLIKIKVYVTIAEPSPISNTLLYLTIPVTL